MKNECFEKKFYISICIYICKFDSNSIFNSILFFQWIMQKDTNIYIVLGVGVH